MMVRWSDNQVVIRNDKEMQSYAMAVGLHAQRTPSEVSLMLIKARDITLISRNKSMIAEY